MARLRLPRKLRFGGGRWSRPPWLPGGGSGRDDGGAGVREPRRPKGTPPSDAVSLAEPHP
ncbi:hypothetical protein [Mangrovactinospora gilvigrisea]|uniref:hypothetical protein n=1 Tax=Mangrovactinospora gilvigrisea TaxID=1428644 RepID=UPI0008FCA7B5|nr:hypothetical protein [Mangrovactinospora gilvigrisea]